MINIIGIVGIVGLGSNGSTHLVTFHGALVVVNASKSILNSNSYFNSNLYNILSACAP